MFRVVTRNTGQKSFYTKAVKGSKEEGVEYFGHWCGWAKRIARRYRVAVTVHLVRTVKHDHRTVVETVVMERTYR